MGLDNNQIKFIKLTYEISASNCYLEQALRHMNHSAKNNAL
jgi:hypothetical protein